MNSNDLSEIYGLKPSSTMATAFSTPSTVSFRAPNLPNAQQGFTACKLFHNFRPVHGYTRTWKAPEERIPLYQPLIPMSQRSTRTPESACNLLPWQRVAAPVKLSS